MYVSNGIAASCKTPESTRPLRTTTQPEFGDVGGHSRAFSTAVPPEVTKKWLFLSQLCADPAICDWGHDSAELGTRMTLLLSYPCTI